MSRRVFDVGPGFVRAKECPDCGHTRCGNSSRIDSADALSCTCNCDAARAEHEAATLRAELSAAQERVAEHRKSAAYFQRRLEDTLDLYRPRLEAAERRCTELEAALERAVEIARSQGLDEDDIAELASLAALSARPTEAAPRVTPEDFYELGRIAGKIEASGEQTEELRRELGLDQPAAPESAERLRQRLGFAPLTSEQKEANYRHNTGQPAAPEPAKSCAIWDGKSCDCNYWKAPPSGGETP